MPGIFNQGASVYRFEKDLSNVVTPLGNSTAAIVVKANQGPTNQRVSITRDKELVQIFGEPHPNLGYGLYAGLEFLKESSSLWVVRATSGTESYSHVGFTTSGSAVYKTIYAYSSTSLLTATGYEDGNKPNDNRDIGTYSFSGELFTIASIGPGAYGNNLAVSVITCASDVSAGYDWRNKYDANPTTDLNPIWPNVFKINVFLKDVRSSTFNSVSGSPVETFYVSRKQISDTNKNNLYVESVVNGISKYIYIKDNTAVSDTSYPSPNAMSVLLSGNDNATVGASDIQNAWTLYNDREKVTVNILTCTETGDANSSNASVQTAVANIASSRKDCIALCQVDGTSSTVTSVTTITANSNFNYNGPSYVANYAGWEQMLDTFNDRRIFIPNVIFGASLMARTDALGNVWDAPAGPARGRIGSLGLNVVWNGTQIGTLRDNNVNSAKVIPGNGIFMWSQRTAQRKNSALSDINVRRLLLFVENSIENSLNDFLFEPNNSSTRIRVKSILDSFLSTVAAGAGFNTDEDDGFKVVCDSSNNTAQTIANNQLVVDVYVKPIKIIEFIQLNTIITRSGVSFEELVG